MLVLGIFSARAKFNGGLNLKTKQGSSITSNSYGFYSAAVVIFALAYLYIDGPAEKGRELPLELSFRGASLTNAGLSALCVSLQLVRQNAVLPTMPA